MSETWKEISLPDVGMLRFAQLMIDLIIDFNNFNSLLQNISFFLFHFSTQKTSQETKRQPVKPKKYQLMTH